MAKASACLSEFTPESYISSMRGAGFTLHAMPDGLYIGNFCDHPQDWETYERCHEWMTAAPERTREVLNALRH